MVGFMSDEKIVLNCFPLRLLSSYNGKMLGIKKQFTIIIRDVLFGLYCFIGIVS